LAHVLHLGKNSAFLISELQLAIILMKNQLPKFVIACAIARPWSPIYSSTRKYLHVNGCVATAIPIVMHGVQNFWKLFTKRRCASRTPHKKRAGDAKTMYSRVARASSSSHSRPCINISSIQKIPAKSRPKKNNHRNIARFKR
jgi:hypothetical protein